MYVWDSEIKKRMPMRHPFDLFLIETCFTQHLPQLPHMGRTFKFPAPRHRF